MILLGDKSAYFMQHFTLNIVLNIVIFISLILYKKCNGQ